MNANNKSNTTVGKVRFYALMFAVAATLASGPSALAAGENDFGSFYNQLNTGEPWEALSHTGKSTDISRICRKSSDN